MNLRYLKASLLGLWLPWVAEARTAFPSSPLIEQKAQFWEKIFSSYGSHQIVMHDKNDMGVILGVINLRAQGYRDRNSPGADNFVEVSTRRYKQAVQQFAERGAAARLESPLSKTIWKAYANRPESRRRLLQGKVDIRGQRGLADTFAVAFQTSELYLPRMEKIFREHGLPPELTRIVFVESMFNSDARSKVGASGFWQLMPRTARAYLRVNRQVDERNSPLKATRAAAKILRANYQELRNWPLAITAYNHGLGGMKRAIRQTGSRQLSVIIEDYRSPSFGFASRNFYAEFLAALRTHEYYQDRRISKVDSQEKSPNRGEVLSLD